MVSHSSSMNLRDDANELSATMQLLSSYNDHTSERDKSLEHIEKRSELPGQPSYDELFKDNLKLRLQLQEYETEIASLKKFVEALQSKREAPTDSFQQQLVVAEKPQEPALPPRSAERRRNAKNLSLPAVSDLETSEPKYRNLLTPADAGFKKKTSSSNSISAIQQSIDQDQLSPKELDRIRRSSSSYSNAIAASPATSVAYTTSRISPSKSNKHFARDDECAASNAEKSESLVQGIKGSVAAISSINDGFMSPLRQVSGSSSHQNLTETSSRKSYPKSPVPNLLAREETSTDFSPSSKQNLNKFADMLDTSFESEEPGSPKIRPSSQPSEVLGSPKDRSSSQPPQVLGSPVALKKPGKSPIMNIVPQKIMRTVNSPTEERPFMGTSSSTLSQNASLQDQQSPRSFTSRGFPPMSNISTSSTPQTGHEKTADSQSVISDIPLFLQPGELNTIRIEIISTLHRDQDSFANENFILFSVIDRNSAKEIFRFAKSIDRIYELDVYLKCHMDTIMLPPLPEKHLFDSIYPAKVDYRREKLNDYFNCLYSSQNLLPLVALKMAKFISTDTVMNPITGEFAKEGVLLMRKSKALGTPNSWRLAYAILNGGLLSLLDRGQLTESIKLQHAIIELQANLPDDKHGTKNGFIVIVPKKSGLSSGTKYYFCCESPKERESWVSHLTEIVEGSIISNPSYHSKSESSSMLEHSSTGNDTTVETAPSYIGPMVNLQAPAAVVPTQNTDSTIIDDERDIKRSRMRSFFPFKRVNASQMPADVDLPNNAENYQTTSSSATNDFSIAKSLQSMDLAAEAVSDKVFGSDLKQCLSLSTQLYQGKFAIPSVVYRCMEYLYCNRGIEEEGIFRISGSSVLIKSLQEQFDKEYDVDLCNYNKTVVSNDNQSNFSTGLVDVNTVTGLLKLYLRKMPHSIFGDRMFAAFKDVLDSNSGSASQTALEFRRLVNSDQLPSENLSLMYVLFELLLKINQKNSINKMNLRNLCIVFSPTLNVPVNVIQPFIVDFNCIFRNEDPLSDSLREQLEISIPQM
ncbi:LANO_0H14026g1_1 [Lachancea nothofagi CBS 11611]|uniref:LANO_0H14026g1_1 n=1 Tax=Lachancea nothofagi CBS 11611 TaxID=1266666 RepID=A0A1G4KML6_9SACH|nr:LANO_0H14026g1_1 [Lachancea nothofagi CBS 11611]